MVGPNKFTQRNRRLLLEYISKGLPRKRALALVGLNQLELIQWFKQDPSLEEEINLAMGIYEIERLEIIKESPQWQAHKYLLELQDDSYSTDNKSIQQTIILSDDERKKSVKDILGIVESDDEDEAEVAESEEE